MNHHLWAQLGLSLLLCHVQTLVPSQRNNLHQLLWNL